MGCPYLFRSAGLRLGFGVGFELGWRWLASSFEIDLEDRGGIREVQRPGGSKDVAIGRVDFLLGRILLSHAHLGSLSASDAAAGAALQNADDRHFHEARSNEAGSKKQ